MICGTKSTHTVSYAPEAGQTGVTWEGWGTSLCWFGHALGDDRTSCDIVCKLLFSKDDGLGFNIVRYNLGGAKQEQVQEYRPGGAVPCLMKPDGGFDWAADAGQLSMLLAAAKLGADTFEAFVNSPPWFWTVSGSSRGHQHLLRSNLDKQHIQDFARFCADVVTHFKSVHGITFRSLSPFNEPASPAWCLAAKCKQEGCYFSKRRAHKVLRALLEQPGLQHTELVASEQFCIRDTLMDLHHTPKELQPAIARVNTHTYDSSTFFHGGAKPLVLLQDNMLARKRLCKLLHKWGDKPLWVSEFGTGRGPLKLAAHIVKDIATLLPSAWVYWQAVEDIDSGWGLLELPIRHPSTQPAAASTNGAGTGAVGWQQSGVAAETQAAATVCGGPDVADPHAGASSAVLKAGETHSQAEVVVSPNFLVLLFLTQAVPVGSRVCHAKGFGSHGFAIWRPRPAAGQSGCCTGWSLVCVNPSKDTAQSWSIAASSFPSWQDRSAGQQQQSRPAGSSRGPKSATETAVAAEGGSSPVEAVVYLLNVTALQPIKMTKCCSSPAELLKDASMCYTRVETADMNGDYEVQVPPGHICRIDLPL